jgi:hypothetical protein
MVKDNNGATAACPATTINVINANPICSSITGDFTTIYTGSPPGPGSVLATATATDADGTIASYAWTAYSGASPVAGTFLNQADNHIRWKPGLTDGGDYFIGCTVTDNGGKTAVCPPFTIKVIDAFDLVVSTRVKSGTTCSPNDLLSGVEATLSYGSYILQQTTDATGKTTFAGLKRNATNSKVCVSYTPPTGCNIFSLETNCGSQPIAGNCHVFVPPETPGNTTKSFVFSQDSGEGWVTAIDGNVEANKLGDKIMCQDYSGELNFGMGFKPYLINIENDGPSEPKAYAFSNSSNTLPTDNILEGYLSGRGGWAFKLNGSYEYLSGLTYKSPGTWFKNVTVLNGATASDHGTYKMSVSDFNALTQTSPYSYSLNCSATGGCKAGILYIEGDIDAGNKVIFNKGFTTAGGKPLLIVTDLPVSITNKVGIASNPTFNFPIAQTPHIQAAILTPEAITVEGGPGLGDSVIMLQGPFASMKSISFNRDVGEQNAKTPAEAVKYNPIFLCEASKLEKDHPAERSYTGLGIFNVQWIYSE